MKRGFLTVLAVALIGLSAPEIAAAQEWYVHRTTHNMSVPPWYCYCYRMSTANVIPGKVTWPMDMQITYGMALERLGVYTAMGDACFQNCPQGTGGGGGGLGDRPGFSGGGVTLAFNVINDSDFASFNMGGGPWGTGQYQRFGVWWNSGNAQSFAHIIPVDYYEHKTALYIRNDSRRQGHVFGTTSQRISVVPGAIYNIRVLAATRNLASNGALMIAVDQAWRDQPITLPAGTYEFTEFTGSFVAEANYADIQIITQDQGEVSLTGLVVGPP